MKGIFIVILLKFGSPWKDVKIIEMDAADTCSALKHYRKPRFKVHVQPSSRSRFSAWEIESVQTCIKKYVLGKGE